MRSVSSRLTHLFVGSSMLLIVGFLVGTQCLAAATGAPVRQALERGGLCVQLGGGNGSQTAALVESGRVLVHRLERDVRRVEQLRRLLESRGLYGVASVQAWDNNHLPYTDNLVTTIIADDLAGVSETELMRVLAPNGVAYVRSGNSYKKLTKPRPEGMDEWTHQWHAADGNAASKDQLVGIPNGMQWMAGPLFPLDARKSSARGMLTTNGRIFYVTQNHQENLTWRKKDRPDYLIARDAFNGLPLWKRLWRPPATVGTSYASLVAVGDTIYGVDGDQFIAVRADNGETLFEFPVAKPPSTILYSDGILVAESEDGLTGYVAESGSQLWHFPAKNPYTTVVDDGRVFALTASRQESGKWLHEVLCVDLKTGDELWRRPTESEHSRGNSPMLSIQFAAAGLVCLVDSGLFQALAAASGDEVWSHSTDAFGRGGWDTRFVGHFYIQGLIWMRRNNADKSRTGQEIWLGLQPETGEVVRTLKSSGNFPDTDTPAKIGCQPFVATDRFILFSRQVTCIDLESGMKESFKFARGGCTLGIVPANGFAYSTVHACGCFSEALRGFLAMTSESTRGIVPLDRPEPSFLKGPAYGTEPAEESTATTDWPSYRRDSMRSAHSDSPVPAKLKLAWQTAVTEPKPTLSQDEWRLRVGPIITAPVVAENRVFVGIPDTHRIVCLDADTAERLWQFTADGRIDSPPTIYGGLCLFGCHDGWVYCVRAADGELVWRRRVAPHERRIVAYGQVESAWPVAGSVLVHDGVAFAAAGRSPDVDGGVFLQAIRPSTGEVVWSRNVTDGYGVSDVLVSDGEFIYLMNRRINPKTGEFEGQLRPWDWRQRRFGTSQPKKRRPKEEDEEEEKEERPRPPQLPTVYDETRYLADGKLGLLESTWTKAPLGLRRAIHDRGYEGSAGLVLAFTPDNTFGYRIVLDRDKRIYSAEMFSNSNGYEDAGPADNRSSPTTSQKSKESSKGRRQDRGRSRWMVDVPMSTFVLSLVSTPDVLFAAGSNEGDGSGESAAGPGQLWSLGADDGRQFNLIPLPAPPVFNGMAAANNRLYIATQNGELLCLEGR